MEDDLNFKAVYWAYLTTKTSKTNGFDTIEIDLVIEIIEERCKMTGFTFYHIDSCQMFNK
jgi:hypothetical protein